MRALAPSHLTGVAADWGSRLRKADEHFPAAEIYGGRGFQEAATAAALLGARLMIVSAGLGLIDASTRVPPYACTILHDTPDGVAGRVSDGFTAPGWWAALANASPFSLTLRSVAESQEGLILAALSDAYIDMISEDLLALPHATLERFRLFTRASVERVPEGMRAFMMPYDDRLDGPDSEIRGTLSDFASRAVHHFAKAIAFARDGRSACEHAAAVSASLDGWRLPTKVKRVRFDDSALLDLMRSHWDDPRGCSLRRIRDEFNVACEQGRFRVLSDVVRAERA
jgi:hypothetical protein|nr:hypothetical protein [Bradyrhizobium sp. CCH5-A9]